MLEELLKIAEAKKCFEQELEKELKLIKVPCPLFLKTSSGLQDSLSGVEKAVGFEVYGEEYEVVHSLAKWKREALKDYDITGLYTDMKAIRKDEEIDELHSLLVEQWDWEMVIDKKDRTIKTLKETVKKIYKALYQTSQLLKEKYGSSLDLPEEVFFITAQELEDLYPHYTPEEREELITKDKKAVFIIGIGDKLSSGEAHGLRSPDYDDWQLNGDLLIYSDVIDRCVEISSMGIRVDEESLKKQLEKSGCLDRIHLPYHQKILKQELPYTIGGGIGSSRVLMLLLEKEHIAEVQASSWPKGSVRLRKIL